MEIQINKDSVSSTLFVNSTPAIDTKVVKTQWWKTAAPW
jgi:type IV pilus assembly protein PilQ